MGGRRETKKDEVYEFEYSLFKRTCKKTEKPVLMILRVHLLAEYYLERLIHTVLDRGDRIIDGGNLTYYQKVVLVSSFAIMEDKLIQALRGLNKVRNRCAHEIDKAIQMSEVELICRPFGEVCTEYRRSSKRSVRAFLYHTLSYICGYLAAQVSISEDLRLTGKEKKKIKTKNTNNNSSE